MPWSILVVATDSEVAHLVSILEARGYAAALVADCDEALRSIRARGARPSLILLDTAACTSACTRFLDLMHRDRGLARVPVILLGGPSGGVEPALPDLTEAVAAVFARPLSLKPLLDRIASVCSGDPQPRAPRATPARGLASSTLDLRPLADLTAESS